MKIIHIILFVFGIIPAVYSQSCSQSITLNTQDGIDNFAIDYPDCTEPEHLIIYSNDITNLNGLSQISNVGTISISNTPNLTDISGLSQITNAAELSFTNIPILTNLSVFDSLVTLGKLIISDCDNLTTTDGLPSLAKKFGKYLIKNSIKIKSCKSSSLRL